jgi:hypothetical protein
MIQTSSIRVGTASKRLEHGNQSINASVLGLPTLAQPSPGRSTALFTSIGVSREQRVEHVRMAPKTRASQSLNYIFQDDHPAACCEVEDAECPGYRKASLARDLHPVSFVDQQKLSTKARREQNRRPLAVVQTR